jgi:VCBS repeat-containing protein
VYTNETSLVRDVITVQVCDSGTPELVVLIQTLTITVTPVNDTPVAMITVTLLNGSRS